MATKEFDLIIHDRNGYVDTFVVRFNTQKKTPKDALAAAKRAVQEYLKTPAGRKDYKANNNAFNWGDAINSVPKEFFILEGLVPCATPSFECEVEHDDDLVGDLCMDEDSEEEG